MCFFPSYDYEELVYQHLEKNKVINRLSERKKVITSVYNALFFITHNNLM